MQLELIGEVSIYIGIGIQIIFSLILGGLVGYDREVKMKAAGFKNKHYDLYWSNSLYNDLHAQPRNTCSISND